MIDDTDPTSLPPAPGVPVLEYDLLGEKVDVCIGDVRALSMELRAGRIEQREHGKMLVHIFEGMGTLVTRLDQLSEKLDRIDRALVQRVAHLEGGLAIVRDHTAAQWRTAEEHRRALRRSDPHGLAPLSEARRELPSLAEIDVTIERKIDQRELDKHRRRWERLAGAIVAVVVAAVSAIVTYVVKR